MHHRHPRRALVRGLAGGSVTGTGSNVTCQGHSFERRRSMSTLSVFAFERKSFQQAGPFRQSHAKLNGGPGLFWEGMWEIPATHAVFAYVRSDTEIAQSLSGALNTVSVLNFLDQQFKGAPPDPHVDASVRTGAIKTSYATWEDVDKTHVADPSAHQDSELITTITIDFHCNTSPGLSALNGMIVL